jgi:hypothetical protein
MGQDITLSAETGFSSSTQVSAAPAVFSSMEEERDGPDWVVCLWCRTLWAPTLLGAACPNCSGESWVLAIPAEPLESAKSHAK